MTLEEAIAWCFQWYATVEFYADQDDITVIATGEQLHGPGVYVRIGAPLDAPIPGLQQRGATLQEAIENIQPLIADWQARSAALRAKRDAMWEGEDKYAPYISDACQSHLSICEAQLCECLCHLKGEDDAVR